MTTSQKQMFIDGEFQSHQGAWIEVINPATEAVIAQVPEGSTEDARRAIDAAAAAQPGWEALPAVERGVWLHKIAAGIRQREAELTATIVAEGGKTQGLAQTEVLFTADYLDYMAEWARRYEGDIVQSDRLMKISLCSKRRLASPPAFCRGTSPSFLSRVKQRQR